MKRISALPLSPNPTGIDSNLAKARRLKALQRNPDAYGGELLKTRRGRSRPRPLSRKHSLHLVLRSTKAVGPLSFRRPANARSIQGILKRFAAKHSVRILSYANVGNHLHLHLRLRSRESYKAFVRAISGAIALAITGASKGRPQAKRCKSHRFFDRRPFSRIVRGARALLRLKDYILVNQLEGFGIDRANARLAVARWKCTAKRAFTKQLRALQT